MFWLKAPSQQRKKQDFLAERFLKSIRQDTGQCLAECNLRDVALHCSAPGVTHPQRACKNFPKTKIPTAGALELGTSNSLFKLDTTQDALGIRLASLLPN